MQVKSSSGRRASVSLTYLVLMALVIMFALNKPIQSTEPLPLPSSSSMKLTQKHDTAVDIPPLHTLIAKNGTIIGDISFLLDFAIIAFPKSGTTFMKDYLNSSSETWLYETEFCIKNSDDLQRFVRVYHDMHIELKQSTHGKRIKFGLKCPGVLYRSDIQVYRDYFPNTKLIIGLRHPVSWFESFYNYQSWRNVSMPPTTELMGACTLHGKVCTDRARFHSALARLGLTDMDSQEEIALLFGSRYVNNTNQVRRRVNQQQLTKLPNSVFLYEVRQIHDGLLSKQLSRDVQQYIQVQENLPEIVSYTQNKNRAISICDDDHSLVRKLLVEHGRDAADWIQNYLVYSPNVVVSASEYFFDLLNGWKMDPCE